MYSACPPFRTHLRLLYATRWILTPEMRAVLRGIDAAGLPIMGVMIRSYTIAKQPMEKAEQFNKQHAQEPPSGNC